MVHIRSMLYVFEGLAALTSNDGADEKERVKTAISRVFTAHASVHLGCSFLRRDKDKDSVPYSNHFP